MMHNIAHFIVRVVVQHNSPVNSIGKFGNNPRMEVDIGNIQVPFQMHIWESCTHIIKLIGYSINGIQSVQYTMC